MYKIMINPTALKMIENHPIVILATLTASSIGTRWIISAILRAGHENPTPRRTPRATETTHGQQTLHALEAMTKKQKQ